MAIQLWWRIQILIQTFSLSKCWHKWWDEFCQQITTYLTCCGILDFSLSQQGFFLCSWWMWKAKGYNFSFSSRNRYYHLWKFCPPLKKINFPPTIVDNFLTTIVGIYHTWCTINRGFGQPCRIILVNENNHLDSWDQDQSLVFFCSNVVLLNSKSSKVMFHLVFFFISFFFFFTMMF